VVERKSDHKILGVMVNANLKWDDRVAAIRLRRKQPYQHIGPTGVTNCQKQSGFLTHPVFLYFFVSYSPSSLNGTQPKLAARKWERFESVCSKSEVYPLQIGVSQLPFISDFAT